MRSPQHLVRLIAVGAALSVAAHASAAGRARISVAGIRKDTGGVTLSSLQKGLCSSFDCVPAARVKRGGSLSFDAVRKERVAGVLFGTVAASRGKRNLELALLVGSLKPRRTWVLPLDAKGRIAQRDLDRLAGDLEGELGGEPAVPAPPPARASAAPAFAPPAPPAPAPSVSEPPAAGPSAAPLVDVQRPPRETEVAAAPAAKTPAASDRPARPSRSPRTEPIARTPAAESSAVRPSYGNLDAGMRLLRRELSYSGVGTGSSELQKFKADGIVSPAVRLEVYPLALATETWPSQFALLASYAHSVGFQAEESARPGVKHDAVFSALDVGVGYRAYLGASGAFVLPRVGYRQLTLEIKAKSGAVIAGLPDAHLAGPSFGLDVEVPFGRFGVFAGAGYTMWTATKDLVKGTPAFFTKGSASAIDAAGGVSVDLVGPLAVRAAVEWSRTSYTGLGGSATYVATGATDTYLGFNVAARLKF